MPFRITAVPPRSEHGDDSFTVKRNTCIECFVSFAPQRNFDTIMSPKKTGRALMNVLVGRLRQPYDPGLDFLEKHTSHVCLWRVEGSKKNSALYYGRTLVVLI